MGVVRIEETPRPDRTIRLDRERVYRQPATAIDASQRAVHVDGKAMPWPPAGCWSNAEAASKLGTTDAALRALRARRIGEDRGPDWIVAPNGHSVAYVPAVVNAYIRARASALKAKADEMLARIAEQEPAAEQPASVGSQP